MIRNSESFVLKDENKINEFIFQIRKFLSLGARWFIFGYINENKEIDISLCKRLINEVKKSWQYMILFSYGNMKFKIMIKRLNL